MSNKVANLGNRVKVEWEPDDNGSLIELNYKNHMGAALIVWRMEDDKCSPAQEAFAHRIVACLNACDGISTEDLSVENSALIEMLKERTALKERIEQLENMITAYKSGTASECARAAIKAANTVMAERDSLLVILTDAKDALKAILDGDGKKAWDNAAKLIPRLDAVTTLF